MPDIDHLQNVAGFNDLADDAKVRVAAHLRDAIGRELAGQAAAGGLAAAGFDKQSHDRGPLFGKDAFDKQADPSKLHELLTINQMDDAAFNTFAQRLAVLKAQNQGQNG